MRLMIGLVLASAGWAQTPVERALAYLSAEVPAWRDQNGCFSCHNNGDGARALYAARKLTPVQSTTLWLESPEEWDKGKSDSPGSDRTLALYQFAAALTSAVEAGAVKNRTVLHNVARRLAAIQQPDGSWAVDDQGDAPGSPVTWGTALATHFGRKTLLAAGGFSDHASRAERWLRALKPRYLHDEAAVLLALPGDPAIRARAAQRFADAQTSDGGWGPRRGAPSEVFDTALVMLALQAAGERSMIPRARAFLIRTQQPAGGWPETTRPAGSQSYAQHISTTAWATMALLAADRHRD
jgi:hypothetical protein